ncbi:MAG: SH3 domain-containing protein [Desulfobacterales bacterium]|nr:SH3 domain-containing protein [Desulfobacterales bacterium]
MKILIFIFTFSALFGSGFAAAERLTVKSPVANIRSGPGTDFDIIWRVGKYHPVLVIKKSGSWCYFRDFEKDEGWIHNSLLGSLPAVITNEKVNNVRAGPGETYNILFTVEKGVPFKVVLEKGDWIQVEHADGDKGWVHKSLMW